MNEKHYLAEEKEREFAERRRRVRTQAMMTFGLFAVGSTTFAYLAVRDPVPDSFTLLLSLLAGLAGVLFSLQGFLADERRRVGAAVQSALENSDASSEDQAPSILNLLRASESSGLPAAAKRLEHEVARVERRARANLWIGAVAATAGVGAMLFIVVMATREPFTGDMLHEVVSLAPRFSFTILVELLAFFFLSRYRESMQEVRYYNNEITTICLRHEGIALLNPQSTADIELRKIALPLLLRAERNFKLRRGETTVELQQAQAGNREFDRILDAIARITNPASGPRTSRNTGDPESK